MCRTHRRRPYPADRTIRAKTQSYSLRQLLCSCRICNMTGIRSSLAFGTADHEPNLPPLLFFLYSKCPLGCARTYRTWRKAHRAARFGQPLSALILDIDHFKSINDLHGHTSGDAALRRLVEGAREELRSNDILARMGGDEFVALLPNTDVVGAL